MMSISGMLKVASINCYWDRKEKKKEGKEQNEEGRKRTTEKEEEGSKGRKIYKQSFVRRRGLLT